MAATLGVLLIFLSDDAQAANRECADNTGLNLVVDTTELGGSVTVKCFENWTGGTAWSGFDALFGLRGTNNFPTSFVCQVGNMPKGDDCRTTDGRQEFWWYSIATNGHWNANPGKGVADSSGARAGEWQDRKSTRLNSSHVAISYAVFCLKKKMTSDKDFQLSFSCLYVPTAANEPVTEIFGSCTISRSLIR